jgi:hypothetical protein
MTNQLVQKAATQVAAISPKEGEMILPIVLAVLFLILSAREVYPTLRDAGGRFMAFFATLLMSCVTAAIGFALGAGMSLGIGYLMPKEWVHTVDAKLVNLRDHAGLSGAFYLGTGYVGSSEYYFYYQEIAGGYQPGRVQVAEYVMVFEEARTDARMEEFKYQFTDPSYYWLALHWPQTKYQFRIPTGTLKRGFSLGA